MQGNKDYYHIVSVQSTDDPISFLTKKSDWGAG